MDKNFIWNEEQKVEKKILVEKKISEMIEHDVVPCHKGQVSVFLGITGSLDTDLQGKVKCICGKELVSFKGDEFVNKLEIIFHDVKGSNP